jgi:Myosin N-terminal SH3-like domain
MADNNGAVGMEVHAVGMDVWVRDDKEGWLKAKVTKVSGSHVKVRTEKGDERQAEVSQCPVQNLDSRGGVEVRPTGRMPRTLSQLVSYSAYWSECGPADPGIGCARGAQFEVLPLPALSARAWTGL